MNLFIAEHITDSFGRLSKEESHHAYKVLRKQIGDRILVTRGDGIIYEAEISSLEKQQLHFEANKIFSATKQKGYLHIAIAPTKSNDRFEFFLEKATEVGIDEITPLICKNSERKVYKIERGQKVIVAAAKQSLSGFIPTLNAPVSFTEFINSNNTSNKKLIAHCSDKVAAIEAQSIIDFEELIVLIGPEGDFTPEEIEKAEAASYNELSLGDKRLRTETAGIATALIYKL